MPETPNPTPQTPSAPGAPQTPSPAPPPTPGVPPSLYTTGSPLMVLLENADTIGQELALNEYQTALDVAGAKAGAAYARTQGSLRAGSLTGEAAFARFGGASASAASLAQANMFGMQAGAARQAGAFRVGTTLLQGAGDVAYLRYGRPTA